MKNIGSLKDSENFKHLYVSCDLTFMQRQTGTEDILDLLDKLLRMVKALVHQCHGLMPDMKDIKVFRKES